MRDSPNWGTLPDNMKETLEMIAHKAGRILNGDPLYDDSWIDIIGYTQLILDDIKPKKDICSHYNSPKCMNASISSDTCPDPRNEGLYCSGYAYMPNICSHYGHSSKRCTNLVTHISVCKDPTNTANPCGVYKE